MGQCRNLMPVALLDEWKGWLKKNNTEIVEKPIPYSPFGVKICGRVYRVYVRDHTHAGGETQHASIHGPLPYWAKQFLKERKPVPTVEKSK